MLMFSHVHHYFQAPSWCDLLALLGHPEWSFLSRGNLGIQGVHNALVYMCLEVLSALMRASEVLCFLYMLSQMNPLADLQIGGKQSSGFLPRSGSRALGQWQGCLLMLVVG